MNKWTELPDERELSPMEGWGMTRAGLRQSQTAVKACTSRKKKTPQECRVSWQNRHDGMNKRKHCMTDEYFMVWDWVNIQGYGRLQNEISTIKDDTVKQWNASMVVCRWNGSLLCYTFQGWRRIQFGSRERRLGSQRTQKNHELYYRGLLLENFHRWTVCFR